MIYICVPTYNEARTVGVLLWKIRQVMTEFPRDYRVLVADDASTDDTPEVLAPYTRVLPLTVYRHEERHGYAASTEMLLREVVRRSDYPRRDIIVTLQADFTEEPDEIPTLVRRIEGGVDVVTGALVMQDAHAPRSIRWTHKLLGYLVRRGKWPEEITDPLSGFRAYRVITVRRALEERNGRPLFRGEGWAANMELLRAVIPFARRVDEAPVSIRYDRRLRESRFRPWETVRGILALLRPGSRVEGAEAEGEAEQRGAGGWEEVDTGAGVMAGAGERVRRNGARQGERRRGGPRVAREATGERRGGGAGQGERRRGEEARRRRRPTEAPAAEAGSADASGAEVAEEQPRAPQGGPRRRRRPRRRPAEGGSQQEARREGAGEGAAEVSEARGPETGEAGAAAGGRAGGGQRRRRRGGGQRRRTGATGAGQDEQQGSPSGAESRGPGPEPAGTERGGGEGQAASSGEGARPASRRGRRGGRRGGRRTRTRPPGTSGEQSSSSRSATEE